MNFVAYHAIIIFSVVNGEISIANYPTMVILNTNKGDRINFSVIYIHVPNKAFLVPDSCRAWKKTGNSISTEITEDTIEND